jgi:hypothetical protein
VAAERPWRSTVYGVLGDPVEPRFLLLGPCSAERRISRTSGTGVADLVRTWLGVDTVLLRRLAVADDRDAGHRLGAFLLEPRDPSWRRPAGARWLGRADLAALDLPAPLLPSVADWLAEQEGGPRPPERPAWARPGWFAEAAAWTRGRLVELGRAPTGPVEQVKSWPISAVLRAPTLAGAVYFKAAPPLFAAEPLITRGLAERFPDRVPAVLAVDSDRSWMLVEDVGAPIEARPDDALRERVLRALGEMQRATLGRAGELFGIGCADRRLPVLDREIDTLLAEAGPVSGASPTAIAELRAHAPLVRALLAALDDAGVPPTLVHGDLHTGNVALRDGQPALFDWTDASVAHPFVDLATLFDDDEEPTPRMADAYLASFREVAPPERLRAPLRLGRALGALLQAVSYHHIARSCEPAARTDWAGAIDHWLLQLCRRCRAYAAE